MRIFIDVVRDCVRQYEDEFGDIGCDRRGIINSELASLQAEKGVPIDQLSFDMRIDGNGYRGIVDVLEIFTSAESAIERFQPIVDDLNSGNIYEEEEMSVFGGFFPLNPGYEIDVLFK